MPFTTFKGWCILFVSHTQLLIPHPSAKLLFLQRLLRTFCCWSQRGDMASEMLLTKLIFCFLNAFSENKTTLTSTLEIADFAYIRQQMSKFKDRFTVDIFFEFSVGPYDLFWKLSWRTCAWSRTPRFKVAIIHLSLQGTIQLSESEN